MTSNPDLLAIKNENSVEHPLQKNEDGVPQAEGEAKEEEEIEYPELETLREYFAPEMMYVIQEKRWISWGSITGLIYCVHLFFALYGVDQFTDISRLRPCKADQTPEEASAVYQTAIGLTAAFHIVEWLRQLVVLATLIIGSNLNILYYVMSINVVYGGVVMLVAIIARFSGDGGVCAEVQGDRALYLTLQIVALLLYIFTCLHMHLIMWCKTKEWCHRVANEPEDGYPEEDEKKD